MIWLEDTGRHLLGVTSPCPGHAPLPGPGLGLATPLAPLARGFGSLKLGYHARPEKGHTWGSSLPEAPFQVGVKAAGCILGDRLDLA